MQSDRSENSYIKKRIDELVPGDIILNPLYRTDGLLLVDKNKNLNETLINIIKKHVMTTTYVLVADPNQNNPDTSYEKTGSTEFKEDYHQLIKEYINNSDKLQEVHMHLNDPTADNPIINALMSCPYWNNFESNYESERLKQRTLHVKQEFIKHLKTNEFFISYFNKIKAYDDVLLIYSLNTTCVSLMIGITLELSDDDLLDLATAALFTNIGYTELPRSDFKSIMRSQEYSSPAMKKHIEIFSQITSSSPYLRKKKIVIGILDHHEFFSGKGYPYGKKSEEISLFGRIINLALTYDYLVGSYNHVPGLTPYEAFRNIYENSEMKFDPNILSVFIHRTTYFKLGSMIRFGNGNRGEIIGFDNYLISPHLPVIRKDDGSVINLLTYKPI